MVKPVKCFLEFSLTNSCPKPFLNYANRKVKGLGAIQNMFDAEAQCKEHDSDLGALLFVCLFPLSGFLSPVIITCFFFTYQSALGNNILSNKQFQEIFF